VAEGAQLIEDLYLGFYEELQKPLLAEQADAKASSKGTMHGQTGQAAHESPKNEAAAKVTCTATAEKDQRESEFT